MKLIVLGSGVCVPSAKRGSPGYYIEFDEECFLIDGGSGTIRSLVKAGIDYSLLDGVFYTHMHPDHTADLVPLLFALKNDPSIRRESDISLYGPTGFIDFFGKLKDVFGDWFIPENFEIYVEELNDGDEIIKRSVRINAKRVFHTDNSLGYRFISRDDKTIVFSGDSGYCKELVELANSADLAVFECSFPEEYNISGHLNPSSAGKLAQQAGVKTLVLSHIYPVTENYPILDRCREFFDGDVFIADDLSTFKI